MVKGEKVRGVSRLWMDRSGEVVRGECGDGKEGRKRGLRDTVATRGGVGKG